MVLTEEQQELIRKNREKALQIRRQKEEEKWKQEAAEVRRGENNEERESKKQKTREEEDEEGVELEEFEVDASAFVSQKEAKQMYCLPDGTLSVCSFVVKDNPHRKGWTAMKLYHRSEIRRRARERFGGLEGLVEERKKRAEKRFLKDLESTKDIFK